MRAVARSIEGGGSRHPPGPGTVNSSVIAAGDKPHYWTLGRLGRSGDQAQLAVEVAVLTVKLVAVLGGDALELEKANADALTGDEAVEKVLKPQAGEGGDEFGGV